MFGVQSQAVIPTNTHTSTTRLRRSISAPLIHLRNMLVPPRSTYRDYLLALSSSYTIYRDLSTFFDASPLVCTKLNYDRETQVPREGEVIIMDCMSDTFITQHYLMGAASSDEEAKKCIVDLEQRPPTTQTRIIIISYWRDTITGEYTGLNKDVLGAVGLKYMIHPEVFMWHFGSDYGLADDWFPNATTPLPSALSSRTYFHLHNHQTLVSPYLHIPNGTAKADTGMRTEESILKKGDTGC